MIDRVAILSKKAVEEYRQIYKERFGTELALEEAHENAEKLVRLFQLVYRSIPIKSKEEKSA